MLVLHLLALVHCATAFVRHSCIAPAPSRVSFHLASSSADSDSSPIDGRSASIGNIGRAIKALAYVAVPYGAAFVSQTLAQDKPPLAVVLGSSGKTGALVVKRLSELGVPVRPTFRGEPKPIAGDKVLPGLTADVTKVDTLESAIKDASVVVFAASASSKGGKAKEVDFLGVANVAKECVRLGIPRLVVISSGAVTRPDSLGYKITNLFGNIMEYKVKGEDILKQIYDEAGNPSLSYVIVRPGGLQDGPAKGVKEIALNQGDTVSGEINREDVAACVAAAAVSTSIPKRVTFEIYTADSGGPLEGRFAKDSGYERKGGSYDEMFAGLKEGSVAI